MFDCMTADKPEATGQKNTRTHISYLSTFLSGVWAIEYEQDLETI